MVWIHKQIMRGVNPRPILKDIIPDDTLIPDNLDDFTIWKIVINILSEPPPRKKLGHINTLQDVLHLLQTCQNIMVLTGAGVIAFTFLPFWKINIHIYITHLSLIVHDLKTRLQFVCILQWKFLQKCKIVLMEL